MNEMDIIIHAKRTLVFNDGEPWKKKDNDNDFDVTMGSLDGAEGCELVVCYMLSLLQQTYGKSIGLYRDDGLGICECLANDIVYQAMVICGGKEETYVGITATSFKARFANHKASFKSEQKRNTTELSKYVFKIERQ